MGRNILYEAISMFVKMNVLIVTFYIIGSNTPNAPYTFILGLLGVVWIVFPIVEHGLEAIK